LPPFKQFDLLPLSKKNHPGHDGGGGDPSNFIHSRSIIRKRNINDIDPSRYSGKRAGLLRCHDSLEKRRLVSFIQLGRADRQWQSRERYNFTTIETMWHTSTWPP